MDLNDNEPLHWREFLATLRTETPTAQASASKLEEAKARPLENIRHGLKRVFSKNKASTAEISEKERGDERDGAVEEKSELARLGLVSIQEYGVHNVLPPAVV